MKTYEVPIKVLNNGMLEIPKEFIDILPQNTILKATFSIPDNYKIEEKEWKDMAVREFIEGYDAEDSIYDKL
ncbi:MAG: hypothetical protein HZB41_05730 [Ignavibacteriae bacterium]|nr:hypothetical protein [Ignavibacteriota bacterium]